jgi:hypothetical protein
MDLSVPKHWVTAMTAVTADTMSKAHANGHPKKALTVDGEARRHYACTYQASPYHHFPMNGIGWCKT